MTSDATPSSHMVHTLMQRGGDLLARWADAAEQWWWDVDESASMGCYGTGYAHWGVQTNLKYVSAMASLAAARPNDAKAAHWQTRALAALRYALATHVTSPGEMQCADNTRWGNTWISALGIERMMHGVQLLEPHMSTADREALQDILISEANWLLTDYGRGQNKGIQADRWGTSGRNDGESNVWNGALLWRTATRYPDHPNAAAWQKQAHVFLINGVSIESDATSDVDYDGHRVRDLYIGDNFFPNYAFDHHGYMNVGYMAIAVSNAAILYFDLKMQGENSPKVLHHHQADLWQVLRRMIFQDGRLARIGGDSRVRYCYCQEFLIPCLIYAADHLGEEYTMSLLEGQLAMMETETQSNEDGSFFAGRLAWLMQSSPYYYCRLESDRASALGMLLSYLPLLESEKQQTTKVDAFEQSVQSDWVEPEYGAVVHRTSTRFASFAWRAYGLAQGMCQPPDDGDLAEWSNNLAGGVWFVGGEGERFNDTQTHRHLMAQHIETFEGGFVTCGKWIEGANLFQAENWRGTDSAIHQLAYTALPDGHTVVGLQHCQMLDQRRHVAAIKGLHLNVPNDLMNDGKRELHSEAGKMVLDSPPAKDEVMVLGGRWACVADRMGVVGVYGSDTLVVDRSAIRRGGVYQSLYVDQICWGHQLGTVQARPHDVLLDVGWAVLATVNASQTQDVAARCEALENLPSDVRGVRITGQDGQSYNVLANFGGDVAMIEVAGRQMTLEPCHAKVL